MSKKNLGEIIMNKRILKNTILVLMLYPLIFLTTEIIFRESYHITPLGKYIESYFIFFLFVSLFYFSRLKVTRFIIAFIFCSSLIINNIHYEVYQNWINSVNYLLMFKEMTEVTHAGLSMMDKVLPVFLYALIETLLFLSILLFKNKYNSKKQIAFDILFYLIFIFMIVRSHFSSAENVTSNIEHSRVKSNFYSLSIFLGKILPYELLGLSDIEKYFHPAPKVIDSPKVNNIILVMGESVTSKHVNYFGYSRETMPFISNLAKLQKSDNILFKETYSAGVLTAISVPALFNAIPRPNGLEQIMKGDTNIFNLAQKQGFETYYYTSQPEQEMRILSLMGKNWMQHQIMPTQLGEDISRGMNDHRLLPLFEKIDLDKGKNLIVLHQRGSHTIYGEYLSEEEKVFKGGTILDNYDSTIHNTDLFLKKIYQYLEKRGKDDYLLIYTSDHGQYVTEKLYNQGTTDEDQYLVPTFIYTKVNSVTDKMKKFSHCERLFHQQISTLLIDTMGFDMPISDCKRGVVYTSLLSGDSGYLEIEHPNKAVLVVPKK